MKYIRILLCMVFAGFIFFSFAVQASAAQDDYTQKLYDEYEENIFSEIPEETAELLEESGLDDFDFDDILNTSPKDIVHFFVNSAKGKIKSPLKYLALLSGMLITVSVCFTYLPQDEKRKNIINIISCVFAAVSIAVPVTYLIKAGAGAINMSSKFMLTFLPVLAGIIASCSNPVLAVSYNAVTLYFAELLTLFSNHFLMPVMGMFFSLVTVGTLSEELKLHNISDIIKSTVTKVLAFASSMFVGVLSIKGILANTADTVAVKGAKLLVSSLVPVIGGALSEAYGSISASLSLVRSSVGIMGIVVVAAINLPVIIELFFWTLSLSAASVFADILDLEKISAYLKSLSDGIKTINIILIFCCMLFIVSTGILLTIKASV